MVKPIPKVATVALLLSSYQGCDPTPQAVSPAPTREYQRFLPLPPSSGGIDTGAFWHGNFAVDTKTGQLCRSWQWSINGGDLHGNEFATALSALPTCNDLFKQ